MDLPEAVALMHALDAESQSRYDNVDLAKHFVVDPREFTSGRGIFLLARLEGEPVGCGAIRMLDTGDAEIKRMYVAETARRRGVAAAVLHELEAEARRLGAKRMILETGFRQVEALALYRRDGFEEISRYEPYVEAEHSVCMAKEL
jgi:GNAT superfamily N-acetyltransferase